MKWVLLWGALCLLGTVFCRPLSTGGQEGSPPENNNVQGTPLEPRNTSSPQSDLSHEPLSDVSMSKDRKLVVMVCEGLRRWLEEPAKKPSLDMFESFFSGRSMDSDTWEKLIEMKVEADYKHKTQAKWLPKLMWDCTLAKRSMDVRPVVILAFRKVDRGSIKLQVAQSPTDVDLTSCGAASQDVWVCQVKAEKR